MGESEKKVAEWAYSWVGAEEAEGPYNSRVEAIDAASDASGCGVEPGKDVVLVGVVEYPDPGEYFKADLEFMMDNAEDAMEGEFGGPNCDGVFEARTIGGQKAQGSLDAVLREWARGWITPVAWNISPSAERVNLLDR